MAQSTNGGGAGSGSAANSLRLLDDMKDTQLSIIHADQFFGNERFLLETAKRGLSGITVMTDSNACRNGAFRTLGPDAQYFAHTGDKPPVTEAEAQAHLALADNPETTAPLLQAAMRRYSENAVVARRGAQQSETLKRLATVVLTGTPALRELRARVEDITGDVRLTPDAQLEEVRTIVVRFFFFFFF